MNISFCWNRIYVWMDTYIYKHELMPDNHVIKWKHWRDEMIDGENIIQSTCIQANVLSADK